MCWEGNFEKKNTLISTAVVISGFKTSLILKLVILFLYKIQQMAICLNGFYPLKCRVNINNGGQESTDTALA